eukprot:m.27484 g.27484  ORF g.27484 m.27484 type:complete len:327 (-) comp8935_c0_seq3:2952-3932(-)
MAWRDRTREFMRYRTALKPATDGYMSSDGEALLSDDEESPPTDVRVSLPPEWVDDVEATKDMMENIRTKLRHLSTLHSKHVNTPDFENEAEEERAIEIETSEITSMFHQCQKRLQVIGRKGKAGGSPQQATMAKNIMRSIAGDLQSMSQTFRKSQGQYLRAIKGREEKRKGYGFAAEMEAVGVETADDDFLELDTGFTESQQTQLRDNTAVIMQREQEITNIVRSINELSTIFRDLAELVADQGTVLDRIDYNLEHAERKVEAGRVELEKADKYHKSASKKYLIILLILVIVGMIFAFMIRNRARKQNATTTPMPTTLTPPTPAPM